MYLRFCLLIVLLLSVGCGGSKTPRAAPPNAGKLAPLVWLEGSWLESTAEGEIDERWSAPSGASLQGMNRVIKGGRVASFEFMMIEDQGGDVVFTTWSRGQSPTQYKLKEIRDKEVSFANPEREFPSRIIYTLEPDGLLHIRAEGKVNGEARTAQHWLRRKE